MLASSFLYRQALGPRAQVWVTHNFSAPAQVASPYAGNLALHVNDQSSAVLERRAALEAQLGAPVQWLNQVHGTHIVSLHEHSPFAPTADASITHSSAFALGILTADCLPVVLCAQDGSAVAAAHAGWRGLLNGVLIESWRAMRASSPNGGIAAHLGPCIGQGQFEVGSEVQQAFLDQDAALCAYFIAGRSGKYWGDLCGIARHQLRALGVQSVSGGGWCTASDPRLASYRRSVRTNQPSGRFATLIRLQ